MFSCGDGEDKSKDGAVFFLAYTIAGSFLTSLENRLGCYTENPEHIVDQRVLPW